jgi:hypothetical protein
VLLDALLGAAVFTGNVLEAAHRFITDNVRWANNNAGRDPLYNELDHRSTLEDLIPVRVLGRSHARPRHDALQARLADFRHLRSRR